MYAASGMRNVIAIATVIVQAAAIRAMASQRPSLGASSCTRKARNGVPRSTGLARFAMMNHPVQIATDLGQIGLQRHSRSERRREADEGAHHPGRKVRAQN